jgi:hypothetical protein
MKYFLVFILIASTTQVFAKAWQDLAQDLSSENVESRSKAMTELAQSQKLDSELSAGLESKDWKEALFVIHHLKKKTFLQRIFNLSKDSEKDMTFAFINKMIDEESKETIKKFYETKAYRIHNGGDEFFKIAFLEAAQKTDLKIEKKILKKLLKDNSFEVRMGVENYFFKNLSFYTKQEQLKFFKVLLKTKPYQVRIHSLLDFSTLDKEFKKELGPALENCLDDNENEVKEKCNEIKNTL